MNAECSSNDVFVFIKTDCHAMSEASLLDHVRSSLIEHTGMGRECFGISTTDGRGKYAFPLWHIGLRGQTVMVHFFGVCFNDKKSANFFSLLERGIAPFLSIRDSRPAWEVICAVMRGVRRFADAFSKDSPETQATISVYCSGKDGNDPVLVETVSVHGKRSMDD